MPPAVPPETMELSRIRLRRPVAADAEAMFERGSHPEVTRYADWPRSASKADFYERLRGRIGTPWGAGSEFYWMIELPGEEHSIGSISCSIQGHAAEFGYLISRRHWGHGYATEAARAVVGWALSQPSIWRIAATCDVDNHASIRVLEKAGLIREGILRRFAFRPNLGEDEPRDACLYARVK